MENRKQRPKDALLTVREAADRLHCSQNNVYALINDGLLPVVRVGRAKGYRIDPQDLQAFIDRQKETCQSSQSVVRPPRPRLKHIKL